MQFSSCIICAKKSQFHTDGPRRGGGGGARGMKTDANRRVGVLDGPGGARIGSIYRLLQRKQVDRKLQYARTPMGFSQ